MGTLTDEAERLVLDQMTGVSTAAIVPPLVIRLMAVNGSEAATGTEITGDVYIPQQMLANASITASGTTTTTNSGDVLFASLDSANAKTVNGYEVWDSAETPHRIFVHAYGSPISVSAGQPFRLPAGTVTLGAD